MKQNLNEVIQLSNGERQEVDKAVKAMVDAIKNDVVVKNGDKYITTINYKMASGEPAKVKIYYSDKAEGVEGMYYPVDKNNLEDNVIKLYKNYFAKYFGTKAKLTGTEGKGEDQLRRVITHELIHAKDPALNHRGKKQAPNAQQQQGGKETIPKTAADFKEYFNKPEELLAFTSQLNDVIVRLVQQYVETNFKKDETTTKIPGVAVPVVQSTDKVLAAKAEELQQTLRDLDQLYAKGVKAKTMSPLTKLFFKQVDDQGVFKKLASVVYKFLEKMGLSKKTADPQDSYIQAMKLLKKYNPDGYEKFSRKIRTSLKKLELGINSELLKRAVKQVKAGKRGVKLVQIALDGTSPPSEQPAKQDNLDAAGDTLKVKRDSLYPKKSTTIPEVRQIIKQVLREIYNR